FRFETGRFANARGVGEFHRPAIERDWHGHNITRGSRCFRNNGSLVTGEGIDERTLADVRRSGNRDFPRTDEMAAERGEGRKHSEAIRVELIDEVSDGTLEGTVILIE